MISERESSRPDRTPQAGGAPRLPYMPGVDGLRALAVGAVVAYHAGAGWLPGGFLGVDMFLVISGFLITSLLLAERKASGRIDLVRFWKRRARRLLPAVLVMMVVVLGAMLVLHPDEVGRLRGAVVASLLYVMNWYQVFAEQSYFEQFARPSVLQHLWSLAVEEQFYLIWPIVLAVCLGTFGRRRLLYGVLAGMVGSAVLAAVLWAPLVTPPGSTTEPTHAPRASSPAWRSPSSGRPRASPPRAAAARRPSTSSAASPWSGSPSCWRPSARLTGSSTRGASWSRRSCRPRSSRSSRIRARASAACSRSRPWSGSGCAVTGSTSGTGPSSC